MGRVRTVLLLLVASEAVGRGVLLSKGKISRTSGWSGEQHSGIVGTVAPGDQNLKDAKWCNSGEVRQSANWVRERSGVGRWGVWDEALSFIPLYAVLIT